MLIFINLHEPDQCSSATESKSIPNRLRNSGLWDGKAKMDPKKLTNVNAILDGSQSYWARPAFLKL